MEEKIQLIITMDRAGQVTVSGPLQNKVVCYGMLEVARDTIKTYVQPLIVVPEIKTPIEQKG